MQRTALIAIAALCLLVGCGTQSGFDAGSGGGGGSALRTALPPPTSQQFWNGRWSPDSKKIVLHLATKGAAPSDFIAVMDEVGMNVTAIADAGTYLATAAWGPGGSFVYYTDSSGISKVGATGGPSTRVATPFAAFELDVSPDGKRLTYTSNGIGDVALIELADGGTSTVHSGQAARFSPDGTQLAFVQGDTGKEHFWLYKFSDKSVRDLGAANTYLASVGWFADGKRLAVTGDKGIELLTLDPAPVVRQVLYADAFASTGIDVSADGKKILYRVNGGTGLFVLTGF